MIPGFTYIPNFISGQEENTLIENIKSLAWKQVKMYGVIAKRRVVHFGVDYTYESRQIKPTTPAPAFLQPFIERSALQMQINPEELIEILITEYLPGAGIGWHRDAAIFGDKVFGISLLNSCVMKLRKRNTTEKEILKITLEPRSGYILSGEARNAWEHNIPPVKNLRYSITMRTLKRNS